MRQTIQQLESIGREQEILRKKQEEYALKFGPEHADRLGKAVIGGAYTNPELTASIGLSDVPIDPQQVHINSQKQALMRSDSLRSREQLVTGNTTPSETQDAPYSLIDLLKIPATQLYTRGHRAPSWYEQVDPGGNWRNLDIPKITDAKEMLNWNEAQILKLYFSSTPEQWDAIPGMIPRGTWDTNGKRVPGTFDSTYDLPAKFPTYKKIKDAETKEINLNQPSGWERDLGGLMEEGQAVLGAIGTGLQTPFKMGGYFIPDYIGPAGGVEVAGVPLPSRISIKSLGAPVRAATKTVTAGFAGAAEFIKSNFEYAMTHPGELSSLGVASLPTMTGKNREDYLNTVIRGNILSQIVKQAVTDGQLDLGGGFFPQGKAEEQATMYHDMGLPQVGGKTFTVGRAFVEPFIKEGYIDRDGYAASMISGLFDATFTAATDPAFYKDPVKLLMDTYGLGRTASLSFLEGKMAERVNEAWAAERRAAGMPADVPGVIHLPGGVDILPKGAMIPRDVQMVIDDAVTKAIEGKPLSAMDIPPTAEYLPDLNSVASRKTNFGVLEQADGTLRLNPMAVDAMPFTADGRRTLEKLTSFKNVGELYDSFLGNVPIGAAVKIQTIVDAAKAAGTTVDMKAIHNVVREMAFNPDPLYYVAEVPGVLKQVVQQTGKQVAQWVSGSTRQFATMPGSTFFSFDDPMASVKDMNRIMTIMKVPKEARYEMLSDAINAVVTRQTDKRFDLANKWAETVIGPQLRANGVPEEFIKDVSKWSGWSDGIEQWTSDAIGQGYPTPYFADGVGEVVRMVDFMPKGFMMVSPENLNRVIRETTNLWKVFKPFRGNKAMETLLSDTLINGLNKIQNNYMKPIALGAPFPIRMVSKILPDEIARIAATENFSIESLKILGIGGHVNYNTMGVELLSAKQIIKISPKLEHLNTLYAELRQANAIGNGRTAATIQKLIDDIEAKFGTREEIQKKIDVYNERIETSLPGTGKTLAKVAQGIMGEETKNPSVMRYMRSKMAPVAKDVDVNGQVLNPNSQKNKNWVTGTSRDIVGMSQDPVYKKVAETIMTEGLAGVDRMPDRFLNGDLRSLFDRYYTKAEQAQGVGAMSPTMPLTSIEGATAWVELIKNDIMTRTAGDPTVLNHVATGLHEGEKIAAPLTWMDQSPTSRHLYEATDNYKTWITDNLLSNPQSSLYAPFEATVGEREIVTKDRLLTKAFSLYRNTSLKYARNPLLQYTKWKRIRELMPAMDPVEAQKMVDALDKSDAPKWLKDSLQANVEFAQGTATRKQVEILGEMAGHQYMDDVLYDSSKKSYFGSRHSLLFGFFDAWMEQWSVWARLMANNPSSIEKVRLANEGLTEANVPTWAGGAPNRGFLFKDEDTGKQAIGIPLSRAIYSYFGLNSEERITTQNLTVLGSPFPGFFGTGAFIFDSFVPKSNLFASARNTIFPRSDPAALGRIADYLVPAWAQPMIGAAASIGEKATGGNIDIFKNIEALMVSQQSDAIRASTLNNVLTNIVSNSDGVPLTADERNQELTDAVNKTDQLMIFKSFLRLVLPGASMTKFMTKNGNENVTTGAILDDYSKLIEAEKSGGQDASLALLQKYGNSAWIFLAGGTYALPGVKPTKEFGIWERDNSSLLDKYPLVGGYLGPQTGEFDPMEYGRQRSEGSRTVIDIKTRQNKALSNLAWAVHNQSRDMLINAGTAQGLSVAQIEGSSAYKSRMKVTDGTLKKQFPMWDSKNSQGEANFFNKMMQVKEMVSDPAIASTPSGKALQEYWKSHESLIASITAANPKLGNDAWAGSSKDGIGTRLTLTNLGESLVKKYPEFAGLWDNVLSKEFDAVETGK